MRYFLLFLFAASLYAHDMWIEDSNATMTLHYGHLNQNSDHEGAKSLPYEPSKISDIICLESDKKRFLNQPAIFPLVTSESCELLFVRLDNGFFTKTPYGTENKPKTEVKMSIKSWQSIESVKYIKTKDHHDPIAKGLELSSTNEPMSLEVGDKIRLVATYDGKPIEGVTVAYDGKPIGVSDDNGHVNVRIKHDGLQHIQASINKPFTGTQCDETIYSTTLNFKVSK